jgi:hypothetical protein
MSESAIVGCENLKFDGIWATVRQDLTPFFRKVGGFKENAGDVSPGLKDCEF